MPCAASPCAIAAMKACRMPAPAPWASTSAACACAGASTRASDIALMLLGPVPAGFAHVDVPPRVVGRRDAEHLRVFVVADDLRQGPGHVRVRIALQHLASLRRVRALERGPEDVELL